MVVFTDYNMNNKRLYTFLYIKIAIKIKKKLNICIVKFEDRIFFGINQGQVTSHISLLHMLYTTCKASEMCFFFCNLCMCISIHIKLKKIDNLKK